MERCGIGAKIVSDYGDLKQVLTDLRMECPDNHIITQLDIVPVWDSYVVRWMIEEKY